MRPFRLLLSFVTAFLLLSLILYSNEPTSSRDIRSADPAPKKQGTLNALFSWSTPTSLFPPSALISLTDDNETFFLARPAAFGPLLPHRGLSGQLWAGSAFADDALSDHGFTAADFEGELGCSDIPGWVDRSRSPLVTRGSLKNSQDDTSKNAKATTRRRNWNLLRRDDGTDDCTERNQQTPAALAKRTTSAEPADIQSLQEGAEIAGKVVMLSRGGCGFMDKVKWAQRRGATALIVGDNVRGGPLVTMYAHGDTSNITIPALFTSHTTAHLLASLIDSSGTFNSVPRKHGADAKDRTPAHEPSSPTATQQAVTPKKTTDPKAAVRPPHSAPDKDHVQPQGFFSTLLYVFGFGGSANEDDTDSIRPPNKGRYDRKESDSPVRGSSSTSTKKHKSRTADRESADDGFIIGVHDWRDPALQSKPAHEAQEHAQSTKDSAQGIAGRPKGGSITPGSGVYRKPASAHADSSNIDEHDTTEEDSEHGWLSSFFNDADEEATDTRPTQAAHRKPQPTSTSTPDPPTDPEPPQHEGLWVTLTPTTISTNPFFDTLLVLVASPLVTLTVVYSLLLLRSRIRRRRWRAPKSVVERLPIRTYHTMPSEDSSPAASAIVTPVPPSPTTPLLATAPRPVTMRARATTDTTQASSSFDQCAQLPLPRSSSPDFEKREAGLAEWRRRYGGRQKECVVCLEEYEDGVSRVMSLPCGHEFHAECITPWLTTRRRTCPICKGDVVRSMARSNHSHPSHTSHGPLHDHDALLAPDAEDDDVQTAAATRRNDDPSAMRPISLRGELDDGEDDEEGEGDLEAGWGGRGERNGRGRRRRGGRGEEEEGGFWAEIRAVRDEVLERWRGWGQSQAGGSGGDRSR